MTLHVDINLDVVGVDNVNVHHIRCQHPGCRYLAMWEWLFWIVISFMQAAFLQFRDSSYQQPNCSLVAYFKDARVVGFVKHNPPRSGASQGKFGMLVSKVDDALGWTQVSDTNNAEDRWEPEARSLRTESACEFLVDHSSIVHFCCIEIQNVPELIECNESGDVQVYCFIVHTVKLK